MKTILFMLAWVSVGVAAPYGEEYKTRAQFQNPWRIIDGKAVNLTPLFESYWKAYPREYIGVITGFEGWSKHTARVEQVVPEGVLIRFVNSFPGAQSGNLGNSIFFLENYPSNVVEGKIIVFIAKESGTHNFTDTARASRTIRKWDYGKVVTPAEMQRLQAENAAARSALTERVRAQEITRVQEGMPRIVAYQLSQASNGYPSFQIEVAKRYMRGDGLPQDDVLAKFWLESACTNRESEATNLLKSLSKR